MRFLLLLPILMFFACNESPSAHNGEMVWVKVDMRRNLNKNSKLVSDFGQINRSDLEQIHRGTANEFVTFYNMRYWTADDKVELFDDYIDNGDYTLSSDLIVSITTLKGDPVLLEPDSVLAPRAREYKNNLGLDKQ